MKHYRTQKDARHDYLSIGISFDLGGLVEEGLGVKAFRAGKSFNLHDYFIFINEVVLLEDGDTFLAFK